MEQYDLLYSYYQYMGCIRSFMVGLEKIENLKIRILYYHFFNHAN